MRNTVHVSLLLINCFTVNIYGAEPVDYLETVVVSATRSERDSILTPGSIKIITQEEIEKSGAIHIVEVLRNQGGIQISDLFGDGSRATISMRGFGGNAQANALILVDGRRLNNSDLGGPDLNSVALKDVERIEIVRGSAGVLFGDQAVGGVVNIITRRPEEFHGEAGAVYGSYNRRSATLDMSNRHANGVGYRVSGEKRKSDNYRGNNEQDYANFFGLLDLEHETGRAFIELQGIDERLEAPGALFIDQVRADREQAFNPEDFISTDTRNVRLGFVQAVWQGLDLQAEYTNRLADSSGILSVGGTAGLFQTKRDHREFTPRLSGTLDTRNGPMILTLGADIYMTEFFLSSIFGAINNDQTQYAVYGQGVVPLADRVWLTLGARRALVNNEVDAVLLPPGTEIDDDVNAFEAGLSFQINPRLRLFGRVDTNYRFVLADEYTSAIFGGVTPDTQTGRSLEFGFDWSNSGTSVSLVAYRLDLSDEIDFDPVLFINTNIGDTERTGFIVDATHSPTAEISITLDYSFVDAEVEKGPLARRDIPFVAKHSARVTADYHSSEHWHGWVEVLGISERVAVGDFFNTVPSLPGYVIGNLGLDFRYGPMTAGFRINNVLDQEYSDSAQIGFRPPLFLPETVYFPAPERNLLLSFSYEFL